MDQHPHAHRTQNQSPIASSAQTHLPAQTPGHHSRQRDVAQPPDPVPRMRDAAPLPHSAETAAAVLWDATCDQAHYRNLAASRTAHPPDATTTTLYALASVP